MLIKHLIILFINAIKLRVQKLLHKRKWVNLVNKKSKKINIFFIVESFNKTDKISLKTLLSADYSGINYIINICCPEDIKDEIHSVISTNKYTFLLPYREKLSLNSILNYNQSKYDFSVITSSHVVYHRKCFQKAFEATRAALKQEHFFFGGFSFFNPNDFKLLTTLNENSDNSYVIKNGFSFNSVIFPQFLINDITNKITGGISSESFFLFFKTENHYFVFPDQGYAEVHSYDTNNYLDKFHPQPNNLSFVSNRVGNEWDSEVYNLPKFKRLVIHVNYGGLGDHFFLSHLPRIAKQYNFYKEVYISNKSVYRSNDYKKMIWDLNPFIDGYTDEMGYYIEFLRFNTENMNILDHIMQLYGIDDISLNHEPEFYYKPRIKPELSDKIIFDPNYISDAGDKIAEDEIDNYFLKNKIQIDFQMEKRNKSVTTKNFSSWLSSSSLEDFCSIIASCKEIYCFATGTATLAAALGKKAHVFYSEGFSPQFLHSKKNNYIKID